MMKDDKLAQDVVQLLKEHGLRVSFAESCTGGMVSQAITAVAGASEVLDMSVVTYANWAKIECTDVTEEALAAHGAVSEQTAALMASGIRRHCKSDIGVGITGIAGPGGGIPARRNSPGKPVGTIYIAIDRENFRTVEHFAFTGERQSIRAQTCEQALLMLIDLLKK
jgi:PncC family amidohydrolase